MAIEVIIKGVPRMVTKAQLFQLAETGTIGPETPINVDGKLVLANRVKNIIFGKSQTSKLSTDKSADSDGNAGNQTQKRILANADAKEERLDEMSLNNSTKKDSPVKLVKLLHEHANINECFFIYYNPDVEVVKFLIEHGADVNAKDDKGCTPLHRAVLYGNIEVVKFLVSHGADVNVKEKEGSTPLYWAVVINENIEITKILISQRADINTKDNEGRTPLYGAASKGKREWCRILLEAGANVHDSDNEQRSAFHQAIWYWDRETYREICEMLLDAGADIHAVDSDDETPLHWAAKHGPIEALEFLLVHGARTDLKDNQGYPPIGVVDSEEKRNLLIRYREIGQ